MAVIDEATWVPPAPNPPAPPNPADNEQFSKAPASLSRSPNTRVSLLEGYGTVSMMHCEASTKGQLGAWAGVCVSQGQEIVAKSLNTVCCDDNGFEAVTHCRRFVGICSALSCQVLHVGRYGRQDSPLVSTT